jgi:iron complex outermembrane receptor protein
MLSFGVEFQAGTLRRFAIFCAVAGGLWAQQTPGTGDDTKPKAKTPAKTTAPPAHHETMVVTGTPEPLPLGESDRSVDAIEVPSRRLLLGNLADVLQLDSSLDLEQRAPGTQADISIRGGSAGQTLVLVNGVRVNDAQSAHHNFDVPLPLDAIQQVEVLRGSGSTLYGSDAVAGVVNVLTRVEPDTELRFRSGIGNFGTNTQSGFFSFSTGAVSQQFSFERELSTGFRDDRDYRNLAGSSETQIRTGLGTTRILLSGLDRPFGADQFYGDYNSWERTKTWFSSLHQDLGKHTDFTLAYRRHTDLFVLFRDHPEIYTNRHEDQTWDTALRRHDDLTPAMSFFYGAEGISESVDSTNLGQHHRRRGAVYGDFEARALGRFSFSAGLREELYGRAQSVLAPSVSGGMWLTSKLKLRASASRAFRLPNYTDLYYSDPANVGNPNLKPEEALDFEGGADLHLTPRWKVGATVFQRRDTNDIDYVRYSPTDIWHATNYDRLHFTGLEALTQTSLTSSQQVELQFTELHGSDVGLGTAESKYTFNYPSQEAIASWQILTQKGILARTRVGVINRYRQSAYTLWDVDVAWRRPLVRPYLQMSNLLNTSYQELVGVPMPGRTALVGVEIALHSGRK